MNVFIFGTLLSFIVIMTLCNFEPPTVKNPQGNKNLFDIAKVRCTLRLLYKWPVLDLNLGYN